MFFVKLLAYNSFNWKRCRETEAEGWTVINSLRGVLPPVVEPRMKRIRHQWFCHCKTMESKIRFLARLLAVQNPLISIK
jgi:hypothetical protein